MTFRAKPTVKRAGRPSHEDHDRRNFYINLLFVLVVAIAVIVLVVVAAASYYNAHLSSVGSVAGQSISRDEFQDRGQIEAWRWRHDQTGAGVARVFRLERLRPEHLRGR